MLYAKYWTRFYEGKYKDWTPVKTVRRFWAYRYQEVVVFPDGTIESKCNLDLIEKEDEQ